MTAFVKGVRSASIRVEPVQSELHKGSRLSVRGAVAPAINGAAIAIHLTSPGGRTFVERTTTNASGTFAHTFAALLEESGDYRLQAFILGGGEAAEAESPIVPVRVN